MSTAETGDTAQGAGNGSGSASEEAALATGPSTPGFIDRLQNRLPLSPFLRALVEGAVAGAVILLLLIVWANLRAERTAYQLQPHFPSKTVEIAGATQRPARDQASPQPSIAPIVPQEDAPFSSAQGGAQPSYGEIKRQSPLLPAPFEGLADSNAGPDKILPIARISDDLTPFVAYRRPFSPEAGKALVAVAIMDFGLSAQLGRAMLDHLSPDATLVLSPYATQAPEWAQQARQHGHEFWVVMPMETQNTSTGINENRDTGPLTLRVNSGLQETRDKLFAVLGTAPGYAGIVSQPGHAFIGEDEDVGTVMRQIFGRGLAFAESNPAIPAYGLSMALEFDYPYVQNNFWIDRTMRPDDMQRRLLEVEQQALRKGKAILFVAPTPAALRALIGWSDRLEEKNLQLAPLSAMVP